MATPFSELVGNPFPDSIQEELERRRSLDQRYETSPTLFNPYFKLRRLEKMSYQDEPAEEYQFDNRKFWELEKVSKQGLDDIEQTENKKAPLGITDVSIEVKDYTFHTITVNFTIPNINDWEIFKETWLKFGAPIEYEFGRHTPVSVENQNDDLRPDLEIREGMVANFEWNLGESNRTINGSLTIYSATWVQLMQEAHSDVDFNTEMVAIVEESLKEPFRQKESNTSPNPDSIVIGNQEDRGKFEDYFYAVLQDSDAEELEKLSEELSSGVTLDTSPEEVRLGNLGYFSLTSGDTNRLTFEKTFKRRYPVDIIERIPDEFSRHDLFVKQTSPEQVTKVEGLTQGQIDEIRELARNRVAGIQSSEVDPNEPPDFNTSTNLKSAISGITGYPEDTPQIMAQYFNYQKFYSSNKNNRYVLNKKYSNIGDTTLQKYTLSQLNLSEGFADKLGIPTTSIHFYVSMKFVNDVMNKIMRQLYNINKKDILSRLILTDVKIRDLSYLGFGSAYPDRMIINPRNRSYKVNEDYNVLAEYGDGNFNYVEDTTGDVKLLEDVHISAETFMELVSNSKSPLGLMQNIIDEIHASSKNLLKLRKIARTFTDKGRLYARDITYFDVSSISDKSDENKAYHTFKLFDAKEKIRDIDIQTDLGDEFAKLAFFRSRGTVGIESDIFYYAGTYYEADGTPIPESIQPQNNSFYQTDIQRRPDNRLVLDIDSTLDEIEFVEQYKKNANNVIQSVTTKFTEANNSVIDRVNTSNSGTIKADGTISFLSYIQAYFSVLIDLYRLKSDPLDSTAGTITIPLKVDLTLDGIAGIFSGQVFKIDLSSFPMAYNIENVTPLFVVSTMGHNFSGNDWESTIGGMLFIPARAQTDAIVDSTQLSELISSKNARLEIINDLFEEEMFKIIEDFD